MAMMARFLTANRGEASWGSKACRMLLWKVTSRPENTSHIHGLSCEQSGLPTVLNRLRRHQFKSPIGSPLIFLILLNSVLLSSVKPVSKFKTKTSRPCSLSPITQANICYQTALFQISKHQLSLPGLVETKSASKHYLSDCFLYQIC